MNLAIYTEDGRLFYELVEEAKRRGVSFLAWKPGERLPLTVKVVLTSKGESSKVKPYVDEDVKVLGCEVGRAGEAVARAILAIHGLEEETFNFGIDPGKTLGLAAVARGIILYKGALQSVKSLVEALRLLLAEWRPRRAVVKVGGNPKSLNPLLLSRLESLCREASKLGVNLALRFVDEAGTTVRAKRRGAKHLGEDELSAVEIALKE